MDNIIRERIDVINQKIKEMNALYHTAAVRSNIPDGEVNIWSALLNTEEEYSQQDLCEMLSLPKQTVNSLISGMVKKGYVTLEHIPGTRNRKVICLSDAGRAYGEEYVKWIFDAEARAMEHTDPKEVETCISMLEKYIQRFRQEIEKVQQNEGEER